MNAVYNISGEPAIMGSDEDLIPHNIDAEQALLGSLMFDNSLFIRHCQALRAEQFYDPVHQRIYTAISDKIRKGVTADAITLKSAFESDGGLDEIGGVEYFSHLLMNAPSGLIASSYASLIAELHTRRSLAAKCKEASEQALDGSAAKTAPQQVSGLIDALTALQRGGGSGAAFCTTQDAVEALLSNDAANVLETGIKALDDIAPMPRGGITLLGGRASMGKSALAVQIADNVARNGGRVDFFSMEMGRDQLAARLISSDLALNGAIVPYQQIHQKKLGPEYLPDIKLAARRLPELNFDDTPRLTVSDIKARCYSKPGQLDLVVIDYLNIMALTDCEGDRHDQKLGYIAGSLRDFAKAANCAVLLLCQLNRDSAKRDNNVPMLQDLRDSGELEQHADTVYFAFRKHYYDKRELENKEASGVKVSDAEWFELRSVEDYFDVVVAKQRMGDIGTCKLRGMMPVNLIQDRAR